MGGKFDGALPDIMSERESDGSVGLKETPEKNHYLIKMIKNYRYYRSSEQAREEVQVTVKLTLR